MGWLQAVSKTMRAGCDKFAKLTGLDTAVPVSSTDEEASQDAQAAPERPARSKPVNMLTDRQALLLGTLSAMKQAADPTASRLYKEYGTDEHRVDHISPNHGFAQQAPKESGALPAAKEPPIEPVQIANDGPLEEWQKGHAHKPSAAAAVHAAPANAGPAPLKAAASAAATTSTAADAAVPARNSALAETAAPVKLASPAHGSFRQATRSSATDKEASLPGSLKPVTKKRNKSRARLPHVEEASFATAGNLTVAPAVSTAQDVSCISYAASQRTLPSPTYKSIPGLQVEKAAGMMRPIKPHSRAATAQKHIQLLETLTARAAKKEVDRLQAANSLTHKVQSKLRRDISKAHTAALIRELENTPEARQKARAAARAVTRQRQQQEERTAQREAEQARVEARQAHLHRMWAWMTASLLGIDFTFDFGPDFYSFEDVPGFVMPSTLK